MHLKPEVITKQWYKVSEIAKIVGVADSCIRYWSHRLEIYPQRKHAYGVRKFTPRQLEKFKKVKALVDMDELTMNGIKKIMAY